MGSERYEYAKDVYKRVGTCADGAVAQLAGIPISIHCWQGDDIAGFEGGGGPSGGIAATGNYPGKARNADELMKDLSLALSLIPGKHRINLHAIYAIPAPGETIPRDCPKPEHFSKWVAFARERGIGVDFNATYFSHPMAGDDMTLSHPDKTVRDFWIRHSKATRAVAAHFGKELGTPCLHNIWIPDGLKDVPADRTGPRRRLRESLDEIFADTSVDKQYIYDSVESKLFGIGVESFTVGSHEFYMNYAASRKDILVLFDSGHYHPTEGIADKLSAQLLFADKIALHVTRGMRWDSDHMVLYDDNLREIAAEIVKCGADRVLIGLDYFDASINRIAAWVIGVRNMQKALLYALLTPSEKLAVMQDARDFTGQLALHEELKTMPFGDVWDRFCEQNGTDGKFMDVIYEYERTELSKRK